MASGNTLLYLPPRAATLPATAYAQLDVIVGASSPTEGFPVLAFDSASIEQADFRGKMPQNYGGGGLTMVLADGANTTTGGVVWQAAFRRITNAIDLDTTAFTYDFNGVTVSTLPNAVGKLSYDNITFTDGADMDSVVAGDEFLLRIRRKTDDAADTAAADAYLHAIEIRET